MSMAGTWESVWCCQEWIVGVRVGKSFRWVRLVGQSHSYHIEIAKAEKNT